jgi:hypothetical protein
MTGRAWTLTAAAVAIALGGTMVVAVSRRHDPPVRTTALGRLVTKQVSAPANTRVRVEIINATRTRGLARRATRLLRDRGFDVVTYTTSSRTQDTTVVLDRSNHLEWARLVGQALGGARVEARPDTSRYVDVTVLLGSSWRAPPQPFSP